MTDNLNISWQRVWEGLNVTGEGIAIYEELLARYSEPWRRYHMLQHLQECIALFGSVAHLATRPAEVGGLVVSRCRL